MLVCVSCNIEFKEDKKFCSYCGGPLVTKEDLVPSKQRREKEEEGAEQKLICPNCKIIYEFGSSCIQCGSGLVTEIPPKEKEVLETDDKRLRDEKEPLQPQEPREKQIRQPRENLICPACKLIYEQGNFCPKCGSPLLPQTLTQAFEEAKTAPKSGIGKEPIQLQTIQEQLIETPRKNLICPHCKIIYERGSSCVRCGSALVTEDMAQEMGTPESPSTPDHAFDPTTRPETPASRSTRRFSTGPVESLGPKVETRDHRVDSVRPSSSTSKAQDPGLAPDGLKESRGDERIEQVDKTRLREQPEVFPNTETDPTLGMSKQEPATGSTNYLERRSVRPRKRKIDYRRLLPEVGSISIMVVAGGYFLWSVYSHITKLPEPQASRSKEVSAPALSNPSNSASTTAKVSIPQETERRQTEQSSVTSKEKTEVAPPFPSSSIPSDALVVETFEIGKIKDLFENIRQANLRKDIDLFVSCYATDFKDRDGKRKATLSFWKKFDYLELSYDLKKTSITGDTARIRIEWVMKISSTGGGQPRESKTFFDAVLKKEQGSWKTQEVKQGG